MSDTTTPPYQLLTRKIIAEQGVNGLRALLARTNAEYPLHRDQCAWLIERICALEAVLAALPEPMSDYATHGFSECWYCGIEKDGPLEHAPDCPWLAVVNARGEAHR
jgi:hypothetical protein